MSVSWRVLWSRVWVLMCIVSGVGLLCVCVLSLLRNEPSRWLTQFALGISLLANALRQGWPDEH